MFQRRQLLRTAAMASLGVAMAPVRSQDKFPNRPITILVSLAPGGSVDVHTRALADAAARILGQAIVVQNRPGAGGTLGAAWVAENAKPDGYTIAQLASPVFRVPALQKTSWDPAVDFTYIMASAISKHGLVVRADAPWQSMREFIAYAKANPGKINYGSPAVASAPSVVMDQLARQERIDWTHVPGKGTSDVINLLLGGHIDAAADGTGWAAQVDSGAFRLLSAFSEQRMKRWPQAPTLRELGYPLALTGLYGFAGPKGMDPQVVQVLQDAFRKAMDDHAVQRVQHQLAQEDYFLDAEGYRKYALEQIALEKRNAAAAPARGS